MQNNSLKSVAGRFFGSVLVVLIPCVLLQVFVPPLPKIHPYFPYITLEDRDLPFFNKAQFHEPVYSFYALDDYIAGQLGKDQNYEKLGEVDPLRFISLVAEKGHTAQTSPVPTAIQQQAVESGGDPLLYDISINEFGFRHPSSISPKPANTLRIVVTGDSLAFGFGVATENTWPFQLEEHLQRIAPVGLNIEVINAGAIAFDSHLGAELIRTKVFPLDPDWIFIGFGFNDYNYNSRGFVEGQDRSDKDYFHKRRQFHRSVKGKIILFINDLRVLQLTRLGLKKLKSVLGSSSPPPLTFAQIKENQDSLKGIHNNDLDRYRHNLETVLEEIKAKRIKPFLLNSNIPSPYYLSTLHDLQEQFSIPFVDFRDLLREELAVAAVPNFGTVPVLFQVNVSEANLPKNTEVFISGGYFSAVEFGLTQLNDNGKNGDRTPGDQIFSVTLPIQNGTLVSFRFGTHSPENRDPSQQWQEEFNGWRVYRRFDVRSETLSENGSPQPLASKVYIYNDLRDRSDQDFFFKPFMAEICHPNSRGHEVLAHGLSVALRQHLKW